MPFEVTQNQGRESSRDFRLFVAPDAICGAFMGSTDLLRGTGTGLSSVAGDGGAVGFVMVVVLGVVVVLWDVALKGKYRKRESHIRQLDPFGEEFLREDERNFRLFSHEVERVKFFRKPPVWSGHPTRPARLNFYLTDGRSLEFWAPDAQKSLRLRDELKMAGFKIENAV